VIHGRGEHDCVLLSTLRKELEDLSKRYRWQFGVAKSVMLEVYVVG